jgi:proline racemase
MSAEPQFQYRESRQADVEAILSFIEPFVTMRQLLPRSEQQIRALTRHGFVAETGQGIVGFAAIEVYSRKLAEVQCLAVSGEMQGRGIGRQLVDYCIERAGELDVVELMAISASEGFLEGCGFDYSLPDQKRALFLQPQRRHAPDQPATVTASSLWHDHIDTMQWPPHDAQLIETLDAHAAGEPLRVLLRGAPLVVGSTMLEKRRYAEEHIDDLRRSLMWEPRGHADMYGALLTAPTTDDGDLGVLFLHNDGFSTMCGHGIIALGTVLWETGMTRQTDLQFDTPAGRVHATIMPSGKRAERVSFLNVPSFVERTGYSVNVNGLGAIEVDIAFGGAYYAFVKIDSLSCIDRKLELDNAQQLIQIGRDIKQSLLNDSEFSLHHPLHDELSFLYGVIFTGDAKSHDAHSRHVCIFANGELDRSPTGTGVSARAALLYEREQIGLNHPISIEGISDATFDVEVVAEDASELNLPQRIVTRVSGKAYLTGRCQWVRREDDPLQNGLLIR